MIYLVFLFVAVLIFIRFWNLKHSEGIDFHLGDHINGGHLDVNKSLQEYRDKWGRLSEQECSELCLGPIRSACDDLHGGYYRECLEFAGSEECITKCTGQ
jgi:hypothetical protein